MCGQHLAMEGALGSRHVLVGMRGRLDLNCRPCLVECASRQAGRWRVRLLDGDQSETTDVKDVNLRTEEMHREIQEATKEAERARVDSAAAEATAARCHLPGMVDVSEVTTIVVNQLHGRFMCLPTALYNMGLLNGEASQSQLRDGPFTYRQIQDYYHLVFEQVAFEELLCSDAAARFVMHYGAAGQVGHAVGLEPVLETNTFLIYDSHTAYALRISDEVLYDLTLPFGSPPHACCLLRVTERFAQEEEARDAAVVVECLDRAAGVGGGEHDSDCPLAANKLKHICLVTTLWVLGIPVHATADGPYWALRDGNEVLRPFEHLLMPAPRARIAQRGRFVLHRASHFFALVVMSPSLTLRIDGNDLQMLQPSGVTELIADQSLTVFSLLGQSESPFGAGAWMPPWALAGDVLGGGRAASSRAKEFPSAKRGKRRLTDRLAKGSVRRAMRPTKRASKAMRKYIKPPRDVPYVPAGQKVDVRYQAQLRNQKWCTNLAKLVKMTDRQTIDHLRAVNILPTWTECPLCGIGKLSSLRFVSGRGWVQRCGHQKCHQFVYPHTHHPVFTLAWGKNKVSLNEQAQTLFCRVAGIRVGQIPILTGAGKTMLDLFNARWLRTVRKHVMKVQARMKFGDRQRWTECEADEVTVRAKKTKNTQRVTWFQFCGLITRGDRKSLMLLKMRTKSTWLKRTGKGKGSPASPGPISKAEWQPMATKHLKLRKIILHTDGARSYRFTKLPGVKVTQVKHKRPNPVYAARRLFFCQRTTPRRISLPSVSGQYKNSWSKLVRRSSTTPGNGSERPFPRGRRPTKAWSNSRSVSSSGCTGTASVTSGQRRVSFWRLCAD